MLKMECLNDLIKLIKNKKIIPVQEILRGWLEKRAFKQLEEDNALYQIDQRHTLRILPNQTLTKKEIKKLKEKYEGKELFLSYLLIINKDFSELVFIKLYSDKNRIFSREAFFNLNIEYENEVFNESIEALFLNDDIQTPNWIAIKSPIKSDRIKGGNLFYKTYLIKRESINDKTREELELTQINQRFSPFCHATDPYSSIEIDKYGLIPRGKYIPTQWKGLEDETDPNIVYFGSIKNYGVHQCLQALNNSNENLGFIPLLDGVFYVMETIPIEYINYLRIDPIGNRGVSVFDSLEKTGSFGIAHQIDLKYIKKYTPKEFYYYAKQYNPNLGINWNEFVEKFIFRFNHNGNDVLNWLKEEVPQIFEEI